jgi:ParB/RepB/Spo0J family partition protein
MAKKQEKAAPAPGAETAGDLRAAWPFPKSRMPDAPPIDTSPSVNSDVAGIVGEQSETGLPQSSERIRVDAVSLYTDPTKNTVERIALEQLLESPFNPRTRYDAQDLQALADTIQAVGIMQPLLARPIWNNTLQREHGGVSHYELVFGHRRLRAAKLAGVADAPVIVRELTNAQAAQLQAIENVQRKDLDAIEEALGYERYIKSHGVTKDQLAAEIGLSRSHVYARLKLLNAVPSVREACTAGEIDSETALLIARIHTPKLQEKALAAIKGKYYDLTDGGKKSFRQIRDFLKEKFTLGLKEAMFDPKDAQLLADAGACTVCPKRSGNAPEYQDLAEAHDNAWRQKSQGEPNLCTDPDCFDAKKKAHLAIEAGKLAAKGKTVIEGNKARAAVGADGAVKGAYIAMKDVKALLAKAGKKPADVPVVTIQNPRDGKTVEAVRAEDLKAAGVKVKAQPKPGGRPDYEAQRRRDEEQRKKREAKAAEDTRFNLAVLSAVRAAAAGAQLSVQVLQLVVVAVVKGVDYENRALLAQLHDCKRFEDLEKKVGQLPADQLTTLLLDCALIDGVKVNAWRPEKATGLLAAAKHYGVDVDQVRKELADKPVDTATQDLLQAGDEQDEELEEEQS